MPRLRIATVAFNKPEFIEYQYKSFTKFIQNEFEYIVYDNTPDAVLRKEVYSVCSKLNISVVRIPENLGDDSIRAGASLNFAFEDLRKKSSTNVMFVDSDIFLVDYYDVLKSLNSCDLLGRYWNIEHIFYYTNQILLINLPKVPPDKNFNFLPIVIDNIQLDCGGSLYNYLRDYPEICHNAVKVIPRNFINLNNINRYKVLKNNNLLLEFFKEECNIFENKGNFSELFQDAFIHLRAGSNWINVDVNRQKLRENNLYKLINSLTKQGVL